MQPQANSQHNSPNQSSTNATSNRENSTTMPPPPVEDEARIGAVIYDMFMRGGPEAENLSAPLVEGHPMAAAIARHFALHATQMIMPSLVQASQQSRDFVVRRISVIPFAWFCSFLGSMFAAIHLWVIFSLALFSTIAKLSESQTMTEFSSFLATELLGKGPRRQLYRWILELINEAHPIASISSFGPTAGGGALSMPDYSMTFYLLNPFISGIIFFILGFMAGIAINACLRIAGGVRLESQGRQHNS